METLDFHLTDFIAPVFKLASPWERIHSLVQVHHRIILTTGRAVYQVYGVDDERRFEVRQIGGF